MHFCMKRLAVAAQTVTAGRVKLASWGKTGGFHIDTFAHIYTHVQKTKDTRSYLRFLPPLELPRLSFHCRI